MGALLAGVLILGIGAAILGGGKADAGPKPQGMIGTAVMRISSGAHTLTITRHAQGYSWYVHRGSDVLQSSNEGDLAGAQTVGLESLQGFVGPGAAMRLVWLLDPMMIARVSPTATPAQPQGDEEGPWAWVVTIEGAERQGHEASRPEAIMVVLDMFRGEQVPVPQPQPEGGIIGEPAKFQHGIAIVGEDFEVQDLDAWIEAASPVVVDAIDAGDTTPQELADAVFGFLLGYDTEGLMVDGEPWVPEPTAVVLSEVLADEYLDVAPPDHKIAAALVLKNHTMVGQAGVENGHAWVVRPVGQIWEWLLFEGGRGFDSDAVDSGTAGSLIDARQFAKDAAHAL